MSYPEPPAVGGEAETLLGSLERQRATFVSKCAGLNAEQVHRRVGASQITIAGLLKHLAYMEDLNFTRALAGDLLPSPWVEMDPGDRGELVWRSAAHDDAHALLALWEQAVARSRSAAVAAVRAGGADVVFEPRAGVKCSLRRLLVDLIEEYARHTGHADLLRESIDGQVGEDPPGQGYPYVLP